MIDFIMTLHSPPVLHHPFVTLLSTAKGQFREKEAFVDAPQRRLPLMSSCHQLRLRSVMMIFAIPPKVSQRARLGACSGHVCMHATIHGIQCKSRTNTAPVGVRVCRFTFPSLGRIMECQHSDVFIFNATPPHGTTDFAIPDEICRVLRSLLSTQRKRDTLQLHIEVLLWRSVLDVRTFAVMLYVHTPPPHTYRVLLSAYLRLLTHTFSQIMSETIRECPCISL